jgi:hypothetical protein
VPVTGVPPPAPTIIFKTEPGAILSVLLAYAPPPPPPDFLGQEAVPPCALPPEPPAPHVSIKRLVEPTGTVQVQMPVELKLTVVTDPFTKILGVHGCAFMRIAKVKKSSKHKQKIICFFIFFIFLLNHITISIENCT